MSGGRMWSRMMRPFGRQGFRTRIDSSSRQARQGGESRSCRLARCESRQIESAWVPSKSPVHAVQGSWRPCPTIALQTRCLLCPRPSSGKQTLRAAEADPVPVDRKELYQAPDRDAFATGSAAEWEMPLAAPFHPATLGSFLLQDVLVASERRRQSTPAKKSASE